MMASVLDQNKALIARMEAQGYQGAPLVSGARAFTQGATFNFADEAEAAFTAGLKVMLSDAKYSDEYQRALDSVRNDLQKFRETYPYLSFAAEMAGGMVSVPGMGGAAFINNAKTPVMAAVRGGAIGMAGGAVAGFGAGEGGTAERMDSALAGSAFGLGAGVALGGGARLLQQGASRMVGPERIANNALANALQRDAVNPAMIDRAVNRAQASEAPMTLADTLSGRAGADANLGGLIDYAATAPGRGARDIRAAADKRITGQSSRLSSKTTNIFGDVNDFISETTDRVQSYLADASQAYEALYQSIPGVTDLNVMQILQRPGVAREMHKLLKDAEETLPPGSGLSSFYNDKGQIVREPSLKELHAFIKAFGSPPSIGQEPRRAGNYIGQVAGELNTYLKNAIPEFEALQNKWRTGKELVEAAEMGQTYGRKPSASMLEMFKAFTPEQQDAFRSGAFRTILERIQGTGDARDVLNAMLGNPAARRNFLAIIPKEQRGSVVRRIADEYRVAKTAKAVTQNSKTAARQEAAKDFGVGEPVNDIPMSTDWLSQGIYALGLTLDQVSTATREKALGLVADKLFSRDPAVQRQAVEALKEQMVRGQFLDTLMKATGKVPGTLPGGASVPLAERAGGASPDQVEQRGLRLRIDKDATAQ